MLSDKINFQGKNILITGASSGIGEEIAKQVAPEAAVLYLVARRKERLERLKSELESAYSNLKVHVCAHDLIELEEIDALCSYIQSVGKPVDILVNNAGFGDIELFEKANWQKLENMMRLNMVSLTYLTYQILPEMIARKSGGILNISSTVGLAYVPGITVYSATKFYVTAFTEGLRAELKGSGISVSQVCPGPVSTEFTDVAGSAVADSAPKFVELNAEECARYALTGFKKRKALIIPGFWISFIFRFVGLIPRSLYRMNALLIAKMMRKVSTDA